MNRSQPSSGSPTPDVDALLAEMEFDLHSVTWGYQELFRAIIAELAENGLLGPANLEATRAFFEVLNQGDKSTFDSVLKAFLEALRGPYRWLLRLPRLFERWNRTGIRLARQRHFLGMRFFELTGRGALGRSPGELEFVLDMVSLLQEKEPELVAPFLQGFPYLRDHLSPPEIRGFVLDAWRLFYRNPGTARGFLACELSSARHRIQQMSRQARLTDNRDALERLVLALTGRPIEVDNLGRLDADDLQEHGSILVGCSAGIYMPETISEFRNRSENIDCQKAMAALAACALLARSFAAVHGTPGMATCRVLFRELGDRAEPAAAAFVLAEIARIAGWVGRFPRLRDWLHRLAAAAFQWEAPGPGGDAIAAALLGVSAPAPPVPGGPALLERLRGIAAASGSWRDTAAAVREWAQDRTGGPVLPQTAPLFPRPFPFFPDPLFPLAITTPARDRTAIDLHEARPLPPDADAEAPEPTAPEPDQPALPAGPSESPAASKTGADPAETGERQRNISRIGYFYDEWNAHAGDYYHDWCCVHELRPQEHGRTTEISPAMLAFTNQVRRIFERLKPEEVRDETRLREGDDIHLDHFIEFVAQGRIKADTEMRFYTKPITNVRDLAVAILLDLSGSTADSARSPGREPREERRHATFAPHPFAPGLPDTAGLEAEKTVLDIEKEAAFILANGLAALGDTFGVFGFTGSGRENCQFFLLKDFEEPWDPKAERALLSANPGASTRIGAALRHAGWKLARIPAKTRLLLLITDGKPCDQGYETETHYAHHDVRMACRENAEKNIQTFCVSTAENTPADMELMFPNGRYLILDEIARLPAVLARLYLRLTR